MASADLRGELIAEGPAIAKKASFSGQDDRLATLKRLDDEAQRVARRAAGPSVPDVIAEEQRLSHAFGGRSVFGYEPAPQARDRDQKTRRRSNRG
jgi:hypothetical protein